MGRSIRRNVYSYVISFAVAAALLLFFMVSAKASGTTLSAGDIVILEFNGFGTDGFSFMPLVDLNTGTTIHFTDYGWNNSLGSFHTSEEGNSSGGGNMITYTAPASVPAGTLIRQDSGNTGGSAFTENTAYALYNMNHLNYIYALNSLNTGHDGVLAFQGSIASPTFLWGYHTGQWGKGSYADYYWSDLPTGLTNATNAVFFADLTDGTDLTVDDGFYSGPTTATTAASWRARVADASNWTTSASGTAPGLLYPNSYSVLAYNASITPASKTFTAAPTGYGAQTPQEFTIQNTGTGTITGLSASLGGSSFVISTALSASSVASGGSVTISVRPVTGLSEGTYTDTLTITSDSGITLTAALSFSVTVATTYVGLIDPDTKTFAAAATGYGTQSAQVFTVRNTGTGNITGLSAALGGSNFVISSALSATTIASGGSATISVQPKTGLSASTYTDTLTITGNNSIHLTASLSFTVNEATYTATVNPTSKTFTTAIVGYGEQASQVFTIQNTGTGTITGLTAALGDSSFVISAALSATSIAPDASVTVSIRPATGLSPSTHTDTLTIAGNNGISLTADLSFQVYGGSTLSAGDIAILEFNGNGTDGFTFMPLVDLASGTVIHFTDYGWRSGAFSAQEESGGASGNVITYTAPSNITAGTLIRQDKDNVGGASFTGLTSWLTNYEGYNYINTFVNTIESHDGLIAFQVAPESPTFIWALQTGGWNQADNYFNSDLPTGLTNGENAVFFADLAPETGTDLTVDDGYYSGPTTAATAAVWRERVANASNWTTSATGTAPALLYPNTYTVTSTTPTYIATINPTSKTFTAATAGYSAQTAQAFTIQNTGTGTITGLSAALSGTNFEISTELSATSVGPGSSVTVSVRPKTGLTANTYTDTLTVTGDNGISLTASLSFTVNVALTYTATISPTGKTFTAATAGYGAQAAQAFTIQNTGTGTITGLSAALSGTNFEISTELSATSVGPGSSVTVSVRPKTGLTANTYTDTLTVTGDSGISLTASLSFTVNAALTYTATINPTSKTFSAATAGYSAQTAQAFTIQNTGTGTITGLSAALSGTNFEISTELSATSAASGSSVTISVRPKTGLTANTYTDTLTVTGDNGISLTASLSFTVNAALTYTATINPTSKTFSAATAGYSAQTAQAFTIQNTGTGTITGLSAALSGTNFEISTELSATSVGPGSSVTVSVRPKTGLTANTYTDTLTVTGDSGISLTASLSFTVNAALTYTATINPTSKTFSAATAGYSAQTAQAFTIQNTGTGTITGLSAALSGTNFEISTELSATSVGPGSSVTVSVRPKTGLTANTYTDTLTVTGDGGISLTSSLSFTVNEAPRYAISATPATVDFPSLAEGYLLPDAQTVTVTNTGNRNISLNQPTAANYTIGTLSATALEPGNVATFTIVPKSGLSVRVWDQSIHIQGSNGVDAQVDIAFTCTIPTVYTILSGNGSIYQRNDPSSSLITLTAEGELTAFTGLTINGELVSDDNYDQASGSTIITLHREYLDSLRAGTYTVRFHYTDGYAEGRFIVYDAMPVTGDDNALAIWGTLAALSLIALTIHHRKRAR